MSLAKIPARGDEGMGVQEGVVISFKEMYQAQQEVVSTLQRLESRMVSLEARVAHSNKTDERSRKALEIAESADKRSKRIEEKLDKIMISIILALATGAISALFYFAQTGLGG